MKSRAFSLIEVVLSLGVVSIALVAIFGLFSSSLRTNRETSQRQEGFDIHRVVSAGLRDTNLVPDLARLADGIYSSARAQEVFYVYTIPVPEGLEFRMTNKPDPSIPPPGGNLFRVALSKCSNISTNIFPLPYQWTNWPGLPVSVSVHAIPNTGAVGIISNSLPVSHFNLVIPR